VKFNKITPIYLLVFSLFLSLLFFESASADNQSCTNLADVFWEDSSGSRLSLGDKVTVGNEIRAVAKTDNSINGAKTADCQGVKVQFKLCNDGRNCSSSNSSVLGESAFDENGRAAVTWTAAKKPGSNTNEFVFEAALPNGQKRTVPGRIVVVDAGEVKTCEISKVTGILNKNLVTAAAETNSNCEGKEIIFKLCRQNASNVSATFTDCFQNLGTVKIVNGKAEASGSVALDILGNRDVSLFVSGRVSGTNQEKFSQLLDFKPGDISPISSISLNFTGFKFKIDNPLAGKAENVIDLLAIIANFVFQLGVPVAVIVIIYSGILFLVSRDKPAIVQKATNGLKYAAIGLAVLLIGKGFVSLIQSILSIK